MSIKKPATGESAKEAKNAGHAKLEIASDDESQVKKSKAPNLFEKAKRSTQNQDDLVKRGSAVTSRDAVRSKTIESHNRRP
jgi:hypothetical protein